MNYLGSVAISERTFAAFVEEGRNHVIRKQMAFGETVAEDAKHSLDHANALDAFVGIIRQVCRNWQNVDSYDYSNVKRQFSNAFSAYKQWGYESYSKSWLVYRS